jgi:hypothetical protein
VKYAVRTLLNSPAFSLVAIVSIAIGIAGNAVIFSAADALFLRARPGISDPGRLVDVGGTRIGRALDTMSYPNFVRYRSRAPRRCWAWPHSSRVRFPHAVRLR